MTTGACASREIDSGPDRAARVGTRATRADPIHSGGQQIHITGCASSHAKSPSSTSTDSALTTIVPASPAGGVESTHGRDSPSVDGNP